MSLYQDYEKAYEDKPERRRHIEGVRSLSVELAKRFELSFVDMDQAAILHDLTKYEPERFHHALFRQYGQEELIELPSFLYHGYSAGLLGKHKYQFNDDIVNAVTHHIVGRPQMSIFEKILMLSDKIEPSRAYQGVETIRSLLHHDFHQAFIAFLKHKYAYDQSHQLLNIYALKTYQYYLKEHI